MSTSLVLFIVAIYIQLTYIYIIWATIFSSFLYILLVEKENIHYDALISEVQIWMIESHLFKRWLPELNIVDNIKNFRAEDLTNIHSRSEKYLFQTESLSRELFFTILWSDLYNIRILFILQHPRCSSHPVCRFFTDDSHVNIIWPASWRQDNNDSVSVSLAHLICRRFMRITSQTWNPVSQDTASYYISNDIGITEFVLNADSGVQIQYTAVQDGSITI